MQEIESWLASHCGPQAFVVRKAWEGPNGVLAVYRLIEHQTIFLLLLIAGEYTQIPYTLKETAERDAEVLAAFAGAQELV